MASDGGVFAFGDAGFYGSMGGKPLDQPVVGITADPANGGYWEVTADGQVFGFGGAPLFGSPAGQVAGNSVVGLASAPDGQGYWVVTSGGGVYSYGSAPFHGSTGSQPLNAPVGGIVGRPVDRRVLVVLRGRRLVRLRRPVRRGGLSRSDYPGPAVPAPLLGFRLRSSVGGPGTSMWCAPSSPRTGRRCRPGGARR